MRKLKRKINHVLIVLLNPIPFLNGMREFRSDVTTGYDHCGTSRGYTRQSAYEWGREWAHRLTFRRYDW